MMGALRESMTAVKKWADRVELFAAHWSMRDWMHKSQELDLERPGQDVYYVWNDWQDC